MMGTIFNEGQVYKLRPTKTQELLFWQFAGGARWVWNQLLNLCESYYYDTGEFISPLVYMTFLTDWKHDLNLVWLGNVSAQVLQQPARDLADAYKRFFKGQNKKPKLKKKFKNDHFRYPQGVCIAGNRIYLPKIGWVKFYRSRDKINGVIKSVTIKHKVSGWYVSITLEVEKQAPEKSLPMRQSSIGLDAGLRHFVTASNGDVYDMPRYYVEAQGRRRKAQKDLSRKEHGSNRWGKQLRQVQKLEEEVARCRKDYQDKLSTELVEMYDFICIESLNLVSMRQFLKLGKSVSDRAIGQFVWMLEYKCAGKGKTLYKADRWWPSSKKCSNCGEMNRDLKLGDEVFKCPVCNLIIDRDLNAAINLVESGLETTLKACGEDTRPIDTSVESRQTSMKREPSIDTVLIA